MKRALSASIDALMKSPKRQAKTRTEKLVKEVKTNSLHSELAPDEDTQELTEPQILLKLFIGLEHILRLIAGRRRHTSLEALREDVEGHTSRSLTTERLEQILALAEGMLEISWVGLGHSAYLALEQRNEDGKPQPPAAEELPKRSERFESALKTALATKVGAIPNRPLPSRPFAPGSEPKMDAEVSMTAEEAAKSSAAAAALSAVQSLPRLARSGSSADRMEALKARIQAKKVFLDREAFHQRELQELDERIGAVEDALQTHAVLVQLFARGEGRASGATELELLTAICGVSFAMQVKRPLSAEAGKAAVARLKSLGASVWFSAEEAFESSIAISYLRRLPSGSQMTVSETLESELRKLLQEKKVLLEKGAHADFVAIVPSERTEVEASSQPAVVKEEKPAAKAKAKAKAKEKLKMDAFVKEQQEAEAKAKVAAKAKAKAKAQGKAKAKAKAKVGKR